MSIATARTLILTAILLCLRDHGIAAQDLPATDADAATLTAWLDRELPDLESFYRELHRSPELSFQEKETARRVAAAYEKLGAVVTTEVGGHGVVGLLENGDGPTLMLRTDLDALPVTEQTNLIYASRVTSQSRQGGEVGVMHACGHDIHMTTQVGVARFMATHRQLWQGTLMLIAQPAEERGAGAKAMLDDGLFERFPRPNFALAVHVDSALETGAISFKGGFQQANVDSVDITVNGRGGHGAYPQATIDPIVQAAELVTSLQTIVSREVDPSVPAVVTVGSIHGGTKHNVISDSCHLQLTVRSYAPEVRRKLHDSIRRKAMAIAKAYAAPDPVVDISEGTPSLFNDESLAARLRPVFQQELGPASVRVATPSMGGEDFSRYGQAGVPILMLRLGSVNEKRLNRYKLLGQSPPSLHSSLYYPDAFETLRTGVRAVTAASLNLLPR